jgi:hypothetical protein
MRYLIPTCVCAMLLSSPAPVCRGIVQHSEIKARLALSGL